MADPFDSWIWLREQYAIYREGQTPPDLYKAQIDWANRLSRTIELTSPEEINSEFWALWPRVIEELDAKGVRAGPESFKGWNDGDAAFVRAIWLLIRHLKVKLSKNCKRTA